VAKAKKRAEAPAVDRLSAPMAAFSEGDYPRARDGFRAVAADPAATGSERETAEALERATRVDRVTLAVGGACLALFVIAAALTAMIQP
jgi:hypothetical protein